MELRLHTQTTIGEKMDNKKMILIVGKTGTGKTTATKYLDLPKTVYIDFDRKAIKSFKEMDKFREWVKIDFVDHLNPGLIALEGDDDTDTIVIDTLSFALDLYVAQKIDTAADTRTAWGEYKKWYREIINIAKASKKSYIFLSHDKSVYNEELMETSTCAYAQGSIYGKIEADFAVVAYTHKYIGEDGLPAYGFLVNPTKDTLSLSAKSPYEMFEEPLIKENNLMTLLDAADAY